MPSQIDPTKPIDGVPASKADLRANLLAAKNEIEALQRENLAADSIAVMRQNGAMYDHGTLITVRGYYGVGTEGGGEFILDAADAVTADNGGSVIVDAAGQRWKRPSSHEFNPFCFGAKPQWQNTAFDSTAALTAFFAFCSGSPRERRLRFIGDFKISAGLTLYNVNDLVVPCSLNLTATTAIDTILTLNRCRSRFEGRISVTGAGGSSLASATSIDGIRLIDGAESQFGLLNASTLLGWGVRIDGENNNKVKIDVVKTHNCGSSARDTRDALITVTARENVGNNNSFVQRTVLYAADIATAWPTNNYYAGFVRVNSVPYLVTEVNLIDGYVVVYPFVDETFLPTTEVPITVSLIYGGCLMFSGNTGVSAVNALLPTRCGIGVWTDTQYAPLIKRMVSQFSGIVAVIGKSSINSAHQGGRIDGLYCEGTAVAELVHIPNAIETGFEVRSLVSMEWRKVFSLRPNRHVGLNDLSVKFPITISTPNGPIGPSGDPNILGISGASDADGMTLDNGENSKASKRALNSTFVVTIEDDPDKRRLFGNRVIELMLFGGGEAGNYTGTLTVAAGDLGYTINGAVNPSVAFSGFTTPVSVRAYLVGATEWVVYATPW